MKIQSGLDDELVAVPELLLLKCWPPIDQLPFPSGEKVFPVFPLLASGLGVMLMSLATLYHDLSIFLAIARELCEKF